MRESIYRDINISPLIFKLLKSYKIINRIPFKTIDWTDFEKIEYKGEKGISLW